MREIPLDRVPDDFPIEETGLPALLEFYFLKESHLLELEVNAKASQAAEVKSTAAGLREQEDTLLIRGGPVTELEANRVLAFQMGILPVYNPGNYMFHFSNWQRTEFSNRVHSFLSPDAPDS